MNDEDKEDWEEEWLIWENTETDIIEVDIDSLSEEEFEGYEDGLEEGEEIVAIYSEQIPIENEDIIGIEIPYIDTTLELFDNSDVEGVTPFARSKKWYLDSKKYVGKSYGSWSNAGATTKSGGRLYASHSNKVSNTFTGQLMATKASVNALVKFDITKEYTKTVGYVSPELKSGVNYRLKYRHVRDKYQVKQTQRYDSRGKVYSTKYVYPQKWKEREYMVVRY
ncbi:hypothetical protein [Oceanobacillus sp. E9]|uniref:hypothetical protein n=1 Tax=Oceanobacillus sp. E9 TaxID=1742575 RepID=UPI001112EF3A|nr:hypothetical protein [Oceanobacillus sp. E9]